jgi:malate dehydrogenase
VLGAAGGIGQPLSLLLKLNPKVTELSCFDLAPVTPGKLSFSQPCLY